MANNRFHWLLIAVSATAIAVLVASTNFGQRLEFEFEDAGAGMLLHEIESDVVVVGIDARSLAALQEWPWPRRFHADLIDRIEPAAPRRLFMDIDFSSRSTAADDRRLIEAVAGWRGADIVLPAFYQRASSTASDTVLTLPMPGLRPYVQTASVNLWPSADGLVRSVPGGWAAGDDTIPAVATLLNGLPATTDADLRIDFTIDPASFTYLSYSDVLENRVPAEYFADKVVFVGATAVELGDIVAVPVYRSLPGVVVQALAYESARHGPREFLPAGVYWPLVAAWAAALCFCFSRGTWRRDAITVAVSVAVVLAMSLFAYSRLSMVVEVVPFLLSGLAAWIVSTLQSLETETLRSIAYAIGFRRRDALLKSVVNSSADSIVCIDEDGVIRTANPAALALFSDGDTALVGTSILRFIPELLGDTGQGLRRTTFEDLSDSVGEYRANTSSGEAFPVELSISRVRLKDQRLYTAIIRDVSERQAQQRQLQFQATHDPLTTLPNRPALAAHLDRLLPKHTREQPLALLMLDLDRFKEVNDTLGHNVGDYVLHEVACRLADVAEHRGFIARIGGDEFALVVDRRAHADALSRLSQQLVDCLKRPIDVSGISIEIGLSIGIAVHPHDARDADTLFKYSDVAMYVAKRNGSGFEFYDSEHDVHSVRRLRIGSRLRGAIAEDRLELHYQPQVNLETGRVESVEALLRWHDEELGEVRPDEFVALAENTDLIRPLSQWTLSRALQDCSDWRKKGIDLRVAINLSARLLQDAALADRLARMASRAGVPPGRIELEITESAMLIDPGRALANVEKLSSFGFLISIDDYGTGYSSLSYLKDLPVHALKLDKSFVTGLHLREDNRVIVSSTAQLAHALNLKVVAEGVETAEEARILRDYGYDFAQGYWYSAALDPDALLDWIRSSATGPEVIRASAG